MRDPQPSRPIVFAGPCLPATPDAAWRELLGAFEVRPPAQRGDVFAALAAGAETLVLLDGYYYTVPAIGHQELLYALDAGVRMVGAASLGALRAAEMAAFGMEGAGRIFEQYRDGEIDGDDEVAILHAPAEDGYRPLTVALVDVRHALERLRGTVQARAASSFVGALAELAFVDRDPAQVEALARERLGAPGAQALARALAAGSLKRDDARRALVYTLAPTGRPNRTHRRVTVFLDSFRHTHTRPGSPAEAEASLAEVWNAAQLLHPGAPRFVAEQRRGFLLASAAHHADLGPGTRALEEETERLRRALETSSAGRVLPLREIEDEAEARLRAELAIRELGGEDAALAALAKRFDLGENDPEAELVAWLEQDRDLHPSWWLVRAFVWSQSFAAAMATATAAAEVHRCFERWSEGRRVKERDLRQLAAELWACEPGEVDRRAKSRDLLDGEEFRNVAERYAAAERLPRAINDYPEASRALLASGLTEP